MIELVFVVIIAVCLISFAKESHGLDPSSAWGCAGAGLYSVALVAILLMLAAVAFVAVTNSELGIGGFTLTP